MDSDICLSHLVEVPFDELPEVGGFVALQGDLGVLMPCGPIVRVQQLCVSRLGHLQFVLSLRDLNQLKVQKVTLFMQ